MPVLNKKTVDENMQKTCRQRRRLAVSWKIKAGDLENKSSECLAGGTCMPGGKPVRSMLKVPRLSISPCRPNQGTDSP